ncbi:MAG TPA: J domain-containing protein [Synergistaceae bacterium]|nr:J domain-containing protein [Synergistaceae bacterium]HPJ25765.1 J domain-containing protein [Synergistaceae bacterium]
MRRHTSYRVLGLSSGASREEIREAYRKKMKEFHPDVYREDPRYALVVREAYESLSGKGSRDSYLEELAEELFPQGVEFTFPELLSLEEDEKTISELNLHEKANEKKVREENSPPKFFNAMRKERKWKEYAFPKHLMRQEEHAFLVMSLLKGSQVAMPPVQLEKIAAFLGVSLQSGNSSTEKDLRSNYYGHDGTLYGGNISYDNKNAPILVFGNILTPHIFYQRYVISRLLGYFLYYPFRNRSIMIGDFLSFFSRYDEEEINTHRFAEELLLPQELFSIYGGKVLWHMERGKDFSYEKFIKKTAHLFQAPQAVVEHRARKFERRIRIAGSMKKEGRAQAFLREIEGLFR